MRKKLLGLFLVLTLVIAMITDIPYTGVKAASDCYEITIKFNYAQTEARKMADMVNTYRSENGFNRDSRRELIYDYSLERAAMQRAAEIAVIFDETHRRPDGEDYLKTVEKYGFDISPRGIMYGENIVFGTEDSKVIDKAFQNLCDDEKTADIMLGYFRAIGIGHIRLDDKIDFWVQVYASEELDENYVAPLDGIGYATVNVPSSMVQLQGVNYKAGDMTVAAGDTIKTPDYVPVVNFTETKMKEPVELASLTFESDDGIVKASGGTMTGIKGGTGTISATLLGKTYSYDITVTGDAKPTKEPTKDPTKDPTKEPTKDPTIEPTKNPTKVPTKEPTKEPTQTPTPTLEPTKEPTKTPTPTPNPTKDPTKAPTKEPTKAPTQEPTKEPTKVAEKPKKGDTFELGGIKYKVTANDKVEVTGLASKKTVGVEIPATIKYLGTKLKVVKIADSTFSGCTKLTTVIIGSNVKAIGKKAFYGCSKLETIKFAGSAVTKIGSKAFSKVYGKAVVEIPKSSEKAYKKLLKSAGLPSKVKISTY